MFRRSLLICLACSPLFAAEPQNVWPDFAPGETTKHPGDVLPFREQDKPKITRVANITQPTFTVYPAKDPNGTGVVILPGGGFGKVVPDLEGSEAATWLNEFGITAFVVNYRTTPSGDELPGWKRPLQDGQRMVSLVRAHADKWKLKEDRIGLVAFSAGGQVGARLLTDGGKLAYEPIDDIDRVSHRPDFAVLIYPWQMYDAKTDSLVEGINVTKTTPPTFVVHTHDDRSSSLGAVLFYAGLKKNGIESALHVYGNGGHGYGLRPRPNSQISSWPNHAKHWIEVQGFGGK